MTSLNLTNFKTGIFNDIFIVENTGRTSIHDIFGSKTDVSNLGGINTTTLTQIVDTITSISTLNSALSDKVSTLTFNNFMVNTNNTVSSVSSITNQNKTDITHLNTTMASVITELSSVQDTFGNEIYSIKSTMPSFLQTTNFNSTINSYLTISNFTSSSLLNTTAFSNTLTSSLSSYTPLTTYNNTITTRLNSQTTSITNITNTIGSLLLTANFNTTIGSYLPTANFNSTIGSYLLTANFNSTIGSYLPTANFNSTIGSYLLTTAFNNTLTSNLSSYTPLSTYNNTITTRLNSNTTSITNITSTIGSLLLTSSFNTTIGNYLLTTAFNNTLTSNLSSYTPLATYNNTITTRLNSQATSITNITNTIGSFLQTTAFNNTLSSNLSTKANITNAQFSGNTGINITGDSALHIVGARNTNPQTTGIRMGNTSDAFSISTDSYGIEICSDADTRGGGTIDFTYPFASGAYYAGRMFYENNNAYFGWNANYTPATSELLATPQMTLDRFGNLGVQNNVNTPTITLNGVDMATGFKSGSMTTNTLLASTNLSVLGHITTNTLVASGTITSFINYVQFLQATNLSIINSFTSNTLLVSGNSTLRSNLNVLGSVSCTSLNVLGNITYNNATYTGNSTFNSGLWVQGNLTANSGLFLQGSLYSNSDITCTSLLINGNTLRVVNPLIINHNNFTTASFSNTGNALYYNTAIVQGFNGGDSNFKIQNTASGTSSLFLNTNNTLSSRLSSDALGNIIITAYTNTSTIKFYSGSTIDYTISSSGGVNGSDMRWKTDVQNITNALDKIVNLQGKTFILNGNPNRQLGFIAQDVEPYVPEAVYTDTSDENNYKFLYYEKLVALMNEGIKELNNKVEALTTRVSALENI